MVSKFLLGVVRDTQTSELLLATTFFNYLAILPCDDIVYCVTYIKNKTLYSYNEVIKANICKGVPAVAHVVELLCL